MSFKLTIGRVGIAQVDLFPNEAIAWLEPTSASIDKQFLRLWLDATDVATGAGRAVKGNTLNTDSLKSISVAFPPLAEQRRIVDLIGAIDEATKAVDGEAGAADALLSSARAELLGATDAPRRPLGDVVAAIDGGVSPLTDGRSPREGEPSVLKLSAVRPGRFRPEEAKALRAGTVIPERALVRRGDVLITRSNTPQLVGHVCVVDRVPSNTYLSDLILRLHPTSDIRADFLVEALLTDDARAQIIGSARGTSGSMRKISRTTIRQLVIPIPASLDEQRAIAALLRGLTSRCVETAPRSPGHA